MTDIEKEMKKSTLMAELQKAIAEDNTCDETILKAEELLNAF